MLMIDITQFGRMVEGLGDEMVPWWIGPHVRDYAGLARSTAVLQAAQEAHAIGAAPQPARAALCARITETAAVLRVASRVEGGGALTAGAMASLSAEIDEYCGTPPRPHPLSEALLAVAQYASSLKETDRAKAPLVTVVERLQKSVSAR
jgi:hypothetical protein